MEKAYAKRWLVLAGVVLVAALLLAAFVAGPALAHGRFGLTSPGGWRHGGMMGGWGYGGWAKASSPSNGRHGMMPYHGTYLPWQGEAGDGSCPLDQFRSCDDFIGRQHVLQRRIFRDRVGGCEDVASLLADHLDPMFSFSPAIIHRTERQGVLE